MSECDDLMSKLRAIENKLNELDSKYILKSDRSKIVEEGGFRGRDLATAAIIPLFAGYVMKSVHESDILGLKSALTGLSSEVQTAKTTATDARTKAEGAQSTANTAKTTATTAKSTADDALEDAVTAYRRAQEAYDLGDKALGDAILAKGLASTAQSTATTAQSTATTAKSVAETAKSAANAAKSKADDVANALSSAVTRIDSAIGRLQSKIGEVAVQALKALGLSDEALRVGGQAFRIAMQALGKVLMILDIISAIMSIVNQIDLRNRMNSLENRMSAIESEVSRLLGRLFSIISKLEAKVANALSTAQMASAVASEARRVGQSALNLAQSAQSTAQQAQSIGQQAFNMAVANVAQIAIVGALAGTANATANRALNRSMTPGPRGLQGQRGLQGLPGRSGLDGKNGLHGRNGKNGLDGKNGINGRNGLNGKNGQNGTTTVVYRNSALSAGLTASQIKQMQEESMSNSSDLKKIMSRLNRISSVQSGHVGISRKALSVADQTSTALTKLSDFTKKAWEATRIQKVLDALTFIAVMHNTAMLSREVGETLFYLVSSSLQAIGIRDEEGGIIDVQEVVGSSTEAFLKGILGLEIYTGVSESWNKANRIVSSASAVIWQVRSMGDATLDLMEWVGEHTGKIGNALKRWGVVGERSYGWMSERPQAFPRGRRWLNRANQALETVEDHVSVYQAGISSVIEVQEEIQETEQAISRFAASVTEAFPDPWPDNQPVKAQHEANKAVSSGTEVLPAEAQKG